MIAMRPPVGWLAEKGYRGSASVEYCWSPVDEAKIPAGVRFLASVCEKLTTKA